MTEGPSLAEEATSAPRPTFLGASRFTAMEVHLTAIVTLRVVHAACGHVTQVISLNPYQNRPGKVPLQQCDNVIGKGSDQRGHTSHRGHAAARGSVPAGLLLGVSSSNAWSSHATMQSL